MRIPTFIRLFIFTTTAAAAVTRADDFRDRFESHTLKTKDIRLPYRLLRPRHTDPDARYPLVLFLHGAGERGDDNAKQLVHGMKDFSSDSIAAKHPCFVVAPQCPNGMQWVATPWGADAHAMPKQPTPALRAALELVDQLAKELPVDPDRIYVTGLSMGGFGTWDAIQRRPKRFAAAVPVCGGADLAFAKQLANLPIWAFHGDSDGVVKTQRSRDMIAAIKKAGGSPKYTEYPKTGHNSWAATYANPDMYAWLFAQVRRKQK